MSELSVNDHLEGILSDFEALKRSFDIEDADDIPAFSTTSPVSTPVSPRTPNFFLNHNEASEMRGGGCQAPSLSLNNNNNNLGSTAHHPHISLNSNPSPVLKSRTVGSSLSFNRGTLNTPAIHNNGSSMARAASFQSKGKRLNPNGYSMLTGPGSDNDSLHSSTSSLEFSGGSGGALTFTKMGSYSGPTPPGEYPQTEPQLPQQCLEQSAVLGRNPNLRKFSSHGSVFHSKKDQGPGIMQGLSEPRGMSHGSISSLDLQICDGGGGMHVVTDTIPTGVTQPLTVQSNGGLSSTFECSARTTTRWGMKKRKENTGEVETDPLTLMDERQMKERSIMGQEQGDDGKTQVQPASMNTQNSMAEKEYSVGVHAEMEEKRKEKGMEEDEMEKDMELEAEVNVELCQSGPGLQMSFIRGTDLFGYIGIEAVLDQMRSKTKKAGFEFNIMVVGQSGLGKSTLVNTLFKSKVSRKSCTPNNEEKISKTVKLQTVSHVIEEKGVKMKLTVIDTPGFGDQINNDNCWEPIVKYVNEQYEKYLREELHINRKRIIPDSRVHCCIYFLPATGHRLRPIDVEFMKRLGKIVSIVPVIAKADTLTIEERQEFKERIRQDLVDNGIQVYPQREYDEDPEERILNNSIRESIPFAVVGTDKEHQVNGNKVLGRKTNWGIIEVENVAHCEFANLRDLLIRSHLQDLKDVTHNIHYETYRVQRLNESNMNFSELGPFSWLLETGTTDKCESESHL
ncbi:septin homolog spn1 isoform X3 [Acanthopagrus latus]|uniref:septin homolog spn1 isoform X3 n=1 Tax=Acanthopagrus latus TaxID=8177 RepID=UPI00187CC3E3|nr:septin homolog spn1 isoform X3 [Acanthopagrus latus]